MYIRFHVNYCLILMTDLLLKIFQKFLITKYFMKFQPVEVEVLHYEGRTERQRETGIRTVNVIFLNLEAAQICNRLVYTINKHRRCSHIVI